MLKKAFDKINSHLYKTWTFLIWFSLLFFSLFTLFYLLSVCFYFPVIHGIVFIFLLHFLIVKEGYCFIFILYLALFHNYFINSDFFWWLILLDFQGKENLYLVLLHSLRLQVR